MNLRICYEEIRRTKSLRKKPFSKQNILQKNVRKSYEKTYDSLLVDLPYKIYCYVFFSMRKLGSTKPNIRWASLTTSILPVWNNFMKNNNLTFTFKRLNARSRLQRRATSPTQQQQQQPHQHRWQRAQSCCCGIWTTTDEGHLDVDEQPRQDIEDEATARGVEL